MALSEKHSPSSKRFLILLILLLLIGLLAGLFLLRPQFPAATSTSNADAAASASGREATTLNIRAAGAFALADANDRLLVWLAPGQNPGEQSAPGQLVFVDGTGGTTPVMDVPAQTSVVMPCGDEATSPDGSHFAFFMGGDTGALYMMSGTDTPVVVDEDLQAMACVGGGTFQWASDSSRFGYIAFEPGAASSEFPDGFMHVYNSASMAEELSTDNVIAFDAAPTGVAYISFFTNDRDEADEAAVFWWSGNAEVEVATLQSEEDCFFTSAQVAIAADGKFLLVMGHRCRRGETRTQWQLYSVDPSARSATLGSSDFQPGLFASYARTNNILFSKDGSTALFTVPDGVTANTVAIATVNLSDMSFTVPLERQAVFPTLSGGDNAFPRISPDGSRLATVVTSTSNDNAVYVWNLADLAAAPVVFEAGSTGDTISSMVFTPDSTRLVFVAGGDHGADNSLIGLDLASGNNFRIARGSFSQGIVVSPSGAEVAIMDWEQLEDPQEPPWLNLVAVNVDSSEVVTLFQGSEIVDGDVTNMQFAYPLVWRRVS
jgi:WD40 repeat protein